MPPSSGVSVLRPVVKALSRLELLALAALSLLPAQTGRAQEGAAAEPLFLPPSVRWTAGPARANLGATAVIDIPPGFKFTDQDGARVILARMDNPAPKSLCGLIAPDSGDWFVVLQSVDTGYLRDAARQNLDSGAMLATVRRNLITKAPEAGDNGVASPNDVGWKLKPVYDASAHRLEYALRAAAAGTASVNYRVHLLGRHGVVTAVAVHPGQDDFDLAPLRELLSGPAAGTVAGSFLHPGAAVRGSSARRQCDPPPARGPGDRR